MSGVPSTPESLVAATAAESESDEDTRAAIYARTSSVSQQFGYSIDEQLRQCFQRCEMLQWPVTHVFRDEAVSGKDTDREQFQAMLAQAESGGFDVLVFWKLDRFSRSIMHAVQLETEFREWDVALHSVTEQIDTTTAAGRFNFRNIANAAEFERELIKQRSRMGHTARAMEGKWPNSRPPLGYSKDDEGRLEVVASEATLVRTIFQSYVETKSMPTLARRLDETDTPKRRSGEWTAQDIGNILRNRIYIGEFAVGEVENHIPEYQILDSDTFEEVTDIRHRFQNRSSSSRDAMPKDRKSDRVRDVVEDYVSFHS